MGLAKHGLQWLLDNLKELDFAFAFGGRSVAVEIDKANREKILHDILKCHMYLDAGADFAIVALPKNYTHTHGVWNLFDFGVQRFGECLTYGFGTADTLGRILLLGFEQFVASTNAPLSQKTRSICVNKLLRNWGALDSVEDSRCGARCPPRARFATQAAEKPGVRERPGTERLAGGADDRLVSFQPLRPRKAMTCATY